MLWSYCAFLSEFIFIQFSGEFSSRDDSCISCPLSFLASAAVARGEGDSVGAGGGEGGADGGGGCAGLDGDSAGVSWYILASFLLLLASGVDWQLVRVVVHLGDLLLAGLVVLLALLSAVLPH